MVGDLYVAVRLTGVSESDSSMNHNYDQANTVEVHLLISENIAVDLFVLIT